MNERDGKNLITYRRERDSGHSYNGEAIEKPSQIPSASLYVCANKTFNICTIQAIFKPQVPSLTV